MMADAIGCQPKRGSVWRTLDMEQVEQPNTNIYWTVEWRIARKRARSKDVDWEKMPTLIKFYALEDAQEAITRIAEANAGGKLKYEYRVVRWTPAKRALWRVGRGIQAAYGVVMTAALSWGLAVNAYRGVH